MVADWMIASRLNNLNGNFDQSLERNVQRFSIGPQLAGIIANTERWLSGFDGVKAIMPGDGGRYGKTQAQEHQRKKTQPKNI
jgi:PHP family Zn ribbon phosphoesterase